MPATYANRCSIGNGLKSAQKDFASRIRTHYSMLGNPFMYRLSQKSFASIRLSMALFWRVTFESRSNLCPTEFESPPHHCQRHIGSPPYARSSTLFLWSETKGLEYIREKLRLSSSAKGENVVVSIPKDNGVFFDAYEPERGIRCTSALQTYLDLSQTGERGEEAAEQLRRVRLTWQN